MKEATSTIKIKLNNLFELKTTLEKEVKTIETNVSLVNDIIARVG